MNLRPDKYILSILALLLGMSSGAANAMEKQDIESLSSDQCEFARAAYLNSIGSYTRYLEQNPDGEFSQVASEMIGRLNGGESVAVNPPSIAIQFSGDSPSTWRNEFAEVTGNGEWVDCGFGVSGSEVVII